MGGRATGVPHGSLLSRTSQSRAGGVRLAILHLLAEEPMHGYQIIQELSSRTKGMWQPSPGAIYPTLQQLDDEGLVKVEEREGKKVYALTREGRALVGDDEAPWERLCPEPRSDLVGLRDLAFGVGAAVMQVVHTGTESQLSRTKALLEETRRRIYEVLAETETE